MEKVVHGGDFNVRENPQTPDGTDNTVWSFFWFFDKNDTVPQFNPKNKRMGMDEPNKQKIYSR